MTSPYLLIEDSLAEGGSGVEDKSFKNIKPGGYVRSGLASLGISFWNKFSGDSWFFQKSPVFPVVMYGCESWTVKKAEHQRIDAFEM